MRHRPSDMPIEFVLAALGGVLAANMAVAINTLDQIEIARQQHLGPVFVEWNRAYWIE